MRGRCSGRPRRCHVSTSTAIAVAGAMVISSITVSSGVAWPAISAGGQSGAAQAAFYTWQAPNTPPLDGHKEIALTFDDGPGPYTPQVLAVLEQYQVPATFFEIGEMVAEYPQYAREVVAAGYPVEDHTWSHPDLSDIPLAQVEYQIDQAQEEIRSVTGVTPACLRPPFDAWDAGVLDQVAQDGLTTMSYSVDCATGRSLASRPSLPTWWAPPSPERWSTCTTAVGLVMRPWRPYPRSSTVSGPGGTRSWPYAATSRPAHKAQCRTP